ALMSTLSPPWPNDRPRCVTEGVHRCAPSTSPAMAQATVETGMISSYRPGGSQGRLRRAGFSILPMLAGCRASQPELPGRGNCQILTGIITSGYARPPPEAALEPRAVRL